MPAPAEDAPAATAKASRSQLWPFAALSASYFAHVGFFNPYLPLWLKDQGYGVLAISAFLSLQAATRLFAPYAWGTLADRTGQRVKLMRYGASAALVVAAALWFPLGGAALFVVLLLMFTHTSGVMPMNEAALAQLVSADGTFNVRRYGRVRLCGSLGFLFTVVLAGTWFERFGMQHFPAWAFLTLGAVVASTWALPDTPEATHHATTRPPDVWPLLRLPEVRWLFVSVFFHVLSHTFIYVFFSLYLDGLGYSKTAIGLLWAVSVVIEIGWFFTQGRWLPLLSLNAWLLLAAGVMVLRMGLTAGLAGWWPVLVLAQALHAVTFAAHHTACIALVSHHFAGGLRGRGQALYTVIGYGLTGVCGGLVGGAVSEVFGMASVFWLAACCAGAALASAWRLQRIRRSVIY